MAPLQRYQSFLAFIVPEKYVTKILKNGKICENLPRDITPRVIGLCRQFCHYTFLILETKCGKSFIEVGPQTLKLLSKLHFNLKKNPKGHNSKS